MERKLVLPLDKKSWECKNLTDDEVKSINSQISSTQNKVAELNGILDK